MAEPTHNHTRWRNDDDPWSPCPPSCPAGPGEEARAEVAREQIAEWLFDRVTTRDRITREIWPKLPEPLRVGWREWADDLLAAVPAVAEALAAVEEVRGLHASDGTDPEACDYCGDPYPCPTVRALGEDGQ